MSAILIASAAAALIAVPVVWYLVNRNKEVKEPTEEPKDPEPVQDPAVEPTEDPVEKPTEPIKEPVEPIEEPQEPIEEPHTEESIEETIEEPEPENEPGPANLYKELCDKVIDYMSQCVEINANIRDYLYTRWWSYGEFQDLFPVVVSYFGDKENEFSAEQCLAWKYAMILSEIFPEKRKELYKLAYNYGVEGKKQPIYGWTMESDPSVSRLIGSITYATTREPKTIAKLRKECGGSTITYKDKIDEIFFDLSDFMPAAPGPYLPTYTNRYDTPVKAKETEEMDKKIHEYISQYYNLDTKDAEKRQRTIQAIADKEHKTPHLFGKERTVQGTSHGSMTFQPVFGKHNLGITIPENGAIAALCEAVGMPSSNNRKSLLNPNYGRRRPGQGTYDATPNPVKEQRALVNYAIEEGDGHSTGYYNNNGDYISNDGTHIGDYGTYFQSQLYANSYPSGHSAYIWGVALILMEVMPDKAREIVKAANEFALSRTIARYHWTSDTIIGRIIGSTLIPVLHATTNVKLDKLLSKAKVEYEKLKSGVPVEPEEKVNTSLSYSIGGYGSCHVDAGEKQLCHCCNKECNKERHPSITVNQRVNFTIEGAGVTTIEGATQGVWEANTPYYIICPKVEEGEEKTAVITMRNDNGVRILKYKLSRQGTHDDGPEE